MRSMAVFSTVAFFYCVATAMASQPNSVKLYGVRRNAAAASLTIQTGKEGQPLPRGLVTLVQPFDEQGFGASQGRASKLLFSEGHKKNLPMPLKTQNIKVKKDSDGRRGLTHEGSIRGGKTEDSTQRKRSFQDWNTAFEANVAMPIRLQSMMKKTSGDSNRRLQTAECSEQDNGLLFCVLEDFPGEGLATVFLDCPVSAPTVNECQACGIVVATDDALPECQSCSICADTVAYDCSNLLEGECVTVDCNGNCSLDSSPTPPNPSTPPPIPTDTPPSLTPSDPMPTTPTGTGPIGSDPPGSSASMRKLGILSISATTIAAYSFF